MKTWWIGIDGTDSERGGCTTWTASNLIDDLVELDPDIVFLDYPWLIRLNPNIPFKTRGNGAIVINISTSLNLQRLAEIIRARIEADQSLYETDPNKTAAFAIMDQRPPQTLYYWALQYLITPEDVLASFSPALYWPKSSQSLVGAICSVAADLEDDHTFELLAYRKWDNCGLPRHVDRVDEFSAKYPSLFSSYDFEKSRELIAPSGPDPVFYGIRSNHSRDLVQFFEEFPRSEPLASFTIFRTNQATDHHAKLPARTIIQYSVFSSMIQILADPVSLEGGHIKTVGQVGGTIYEVMWFEPTKHLRDSARLLAAGDWIYLIASVHKRPDQLLPVLQSEVMLVLDAPLTQKRQPPICTCGARMTSAGTFAGYKCRTCSNRTKFAEIVTESRELDHGDLIHASLSAQRHLTRPVSRWLRRNTLKANPVEYSTFRRKFD